MQNRALDQVNVFREQTVEDLMEFIRIPSQSGTPELKQEVLRAAQWMAGKLEAVGADHVRILPTAGNPVVYADWIHDPEAPTVLVYGHYDVQPPEPLNEWESPAYAPQVREGRIYGRGASDDKAGLVLALAVLRAFKAAGEVPSVNLKFCFEGEEEVGSPNLGPFIEQEADRFSADLVLSVDGGQWSETQPQVLLGYRGIVAMELKVEGPAKDLHSGLMGGAVLNPVEGLVRLLGSMKDPEGRITIEGFHDEVRAVSEAERDAMNRIPGNVEALTEAAWGAPLTGEPGYTAIERTWIRPTLDINGIWGGHSGPGAKTIIPARAGCKISCRLVADQDPNRIVGLIRAHVEKHTPEGISATLDFEPSRAWPYSIPADHPARKVLKEVLEEVFECPAFETRVGGSIPVTYVFSQILKAETIGLGCSTPNCNLHAPNEWVSLELLHRSTKCAVLLLQRIGTRLAEARD